MYGIIEVVLPTPDCIPLKTEAGQMRALASKARGSSRLLMLHSQSVGLKQPLVKESVPTPGRGSQVVQSHALLLAASV